MSNLPQISPAQLELLLKMAGKQLHIDPQELRRQLESGDLRAVSTGLSGQAGQQLDRLLSDPQKAQQLLSQPDLQKFLQTLR
ncbi:MAG: hypothetical protein U0K65_01445 [Negativibacillus sp.]|nr:hypothetical protein [Negativibacillus sp.]